MKQLVFSIQQKTFRHVTAGTQSQQMSVVLFEYFRGNNSFHSVDFLQQLVLVDFAVGT